MTTYEARECHTIRNPHRDAPGRYIRPKTDNVDITFEKFATLYNFVFEKQWEKPYAIFREMLGSRLYLTPIPKL